MEGKSPISAQILTFQSERTLPRALSSVAFCAEILVIDGGSTDQTMELARQAGATIIPQHPNGGSGPITDFAAIRNLGLFNATQPWILVLDSDEEISPSLREELIRIAAHDEPAVYFVPRKYVLEDGTVVEHASTYPNERLYFFHRDATDGWKKPVHERIGILPGVPVKRLTHPSLAPLPSIEEYKKKNLRYLRIEAERTAGWGAWLRRVMHTIRGRLVTTVRLLSIWLLPKKGARLPLRYEMLRYWYGWKLIVRTCPLSRRS